MSNEPTRLTNLTTHRSHRRLVASWRAAAPALLALACSCDRSPPPGAADGAAPPPQPQSGTPELPRELEPKAATPEVPAAEPAPHPGPWFAITSIAAAVYSEPSFDRQKKLGYARNGAKLPVEAKPVSTQSCTGGWYRVIGGGYVCGNVGTVDLNHPQVRFATRQPNLDEVLPYTYARNAKNGTPLYKSVPSREQMLAYEPYLDTAKKAPKEEPAAKEAPAPDAVSRASTKPGEPLQRASLSTDAGAPPALLPDGSAPLGQSEADAVQPWWPKENAKDKLHEIKLEQLEADADDVLAKRMVSGFYIAVDKTFSWNGRSWYKSTKGLVAPSDRFWQTSASKFQGVELDGKQFKLPIAWVPGFREKTGLYDIDEANSAIKNSGTVERFTPIQLTGKTLELRGTQYSQTADGKWVKESHVRITKPAAPPADLSATEKWVAVNLKEQTLVAFEGTRPVYATLVSTGKESKVKEKDHRTPLGEWRVREKHITTTMDGDGSAAGDLPYSIEDVPYVMYYHRSYALHGAFWHRNYGAQMSHGCVNLSPLDAKRLFFFTDPPLPPGWHGVWSNNEQAGSRILVHE